LAIVGSAVPTTVASMAATNSESIKPAITRTSGGVHGTRVAGALPYSGQLGVGDGGGEGDGLGLGDGGGKGEGEGLGDGEVERAGGAAGAVAGGTGCP